MKKKLSIILVIALIVIVAVAALVLHQPYKPITFEIAGENGFGYDPIFYIPEFGCTTAELSPEQKNEVSHRGKALRKMKEIIEQRIAE